MDKDRKVGSSLTVSPKCEERLLSRRLENGRSANRLRAVPVAECTFLSDALPFSFIEHNKNVGLAKSP